MSDLGSGGAQGGGASIVAAVGTATGSGVVDFTRSPTTPRRVVTVPVDVRVAVVLRLRGT